MVTAGDLLVLGAVAFLGGAFGAAVGAYRALAVSGVLVVVDVARATVLGGPSPALGTGQLLGLGPAFGPHVVVGGGAAAAAYAARKGYLETGFRFHEAKHVTRPLWRHLDALAVGGVFGVVGFALARVSLALSLPWDPLAASVVVSAFLHRLLLGYPAIGDVRGGLLDMTPYERGEQRRSVVDGTPTRRLRVEPWLPGRYQWLRVAAAGTLVGAVAGTVALLTGRPLLAYGLAAAALLAFRFEGDEFPELPAQFDGAQFPDLPVRVTGEQFFVVHHVAFVAGVLAVGLGSGDGSPGPLTALVAGAGIGLVTALAAQAAARVCYAHADTHFDPPSAGILVGSLLVALLDVLGVVQQSVVPAPF
jgi:hypothetical protein